MPKPYAGGMALTDDAIAKIKVKIISGEWSPGDRLPPEHVLGDQLGISRNSLREAVKALAFLGVLDVRHGGGTYVTSLEPEILMTSLAFLTDMHDDRGLREMFHIRRVLESHAGREAARTATAEEVQALRDELKTADEISTTSAYLEHGAEFHRVLCNISGNRYLTALVTSLAARPLFDRVTIEPLTAETINSTVREHSAIVAAIAQGDADRAAALIEQHVAEIDFWVRDSDGTPLRNSLGSMPAAHGTN